MQELKNVPIESVSSPKSVVCVRSTDSVKVVFEKLIEHHILSVPVYDENTKAYLGLVDVLDIVAFLVQLFGDKYDSRKVFASESKFASTPISGITDLSKRNPFIYISKDQSVFEVANILVNGAPGGIQRVCVVENGKVVSIITQSSFVEYIYQKDILKDKKNSTLAELKLGFREVPTIRLTETALAAFKRIHTEKLTALAVVDEQNRIFSNISGKDLKVVKNEDGILHLESYQFSRLLLPVEEYLSLAKHDELNVRSPVFASGSDDTLAELLEKIVKLKVHRIYIVDEKSQPLGVVNLVDIIKLVL